MKKALLILTSLFLVCPVSAAPNNAVEQSTPVEQQQTPTAQERIQQLAYTAQNIKASSEERADALRQLSRFPNQNSLVAVARALKDKDPIVREAAIVGAEPYKAEHRWSMISPLLKDKVEKVRITAAMNLVRDFSNMDKAQQAQLEPVVSELKAHLKARSDQDSQLLLADTYRWHQEWQKADELYRSLLEDDLHNPQIWLSLADNERGQEHNQKAIEILDKALKTLPNNADLHYSKSLALVRLGQKEQASKEIKSAATLAKDNSYYWYLNGVLQEEFDVTASTASFEKAYLISGAPEQLYAVCDIYARYGNPKAQQCIDELSQYAPEYVIKELTSKIKQ
ncbi:tetratricopeptide repeat protein [Vibrio algivorus]|uniref:Tetratricopeptide repeat protein n=1 Tax=Vibrio algivorus TaxID=1667024 RepID=A0ABQ6ELP8_9VIBR|nr:tetratricopeptide repeat protein [Vibrio algivorus]GLT13696.1 hypothetical protein GCM10007931_06700 [Vibrio algivorus]